MVDEVRLRRERRAADGDHAAWEEIYRDVYPRLRAFVARRVGGIAVEDVVSETMTRAVAAVSRYRPTGPGIEAWIFGIARKVVADHHRRAGRDLRRSVPAPVSLDPPPGEALGIADDHARVRAGFQLLSAGDRELLELRFVAGLNPEEVAAVLGKRPGAVRTAQTRALERLRRIIETAT